MKRDPISWFGIVLLSLALINSTQTLSGQAVEKLAPFDRFIGEWKMDSALQVFEWGPGKSSVIARSYQIDNEGNGSKTLVSQGIWFWHPGKQKIKGYVSAINMPVSFFDYSSKFVNGALFSELEAYDTNGRKSFYHESMEITSDNTYEWKLSQEGQVIMQGVFTLQ
jgi:hypothetical protein